MRESPLVSIIMGIYNCKDTLRESIDSIVNQTYENWELILCDDCSSDNTYEIAKEYEEKYSEKIVLIQNEKNIGLAGALNRCLEYSRGKYIARQDGDDISLPSRLSTQIEFLEKNKEYDLVSTPMISFDEKDEVGVVGKLKEIPDKNKLALGPPFCHATIMTKSCVYKKLKGYRVTKYTRRCEDIDLWFRFFNEGFKGINLETPLYKVRVDSNAFKRRNLKSYLYATKVCFDGYKLIKAPIRSYIYLSKPIIAAFTPTALKKIYQNRENKG